MDIFLRLDEPPHRKFVGQRIAMSLTQDCTLALWRRFMPLQKNLQQKVGTDLYCMQVYKSPVYFSAFDARNEFEKWAAVPVTDFNDIPGQLENFELPTGPYAVFMHRGTTADFAKTAAYIFETWLPQSAYELDHRPHFEIMGRGYKNNSADAEEEIWIPVKNKTVSGAPVHSPATSIAALKKQ